MSRNITSDNSSREAEFDWDLYLIETKSVAAPACNFKQALIPPVNEFNLGEKLESIDPRNQDSWCIGTVVEKDGPRLRIRLDGTDDRNDFWRLVDSGDIRCYGKTVELGGQIVPPLGFQQNSTRWAKYFEKHVKNGPFALESSFKPQPAKPERNLFKRGDKLEAVDPKHPHVICPGTVNNILPGEYRIMLALDGWSSLNNFKIDYLSREIFPVGWCKLAGIRIGKLGGNPPSRTSNKTFTLTPNKQNGNNRQELNNMKTSVSPVSNDSSYSPTTMDEKNNNLTTNTSTMKKEHRYSIDLYRANGNIKKEEPIVTVYLNYIGDNSGMLLNPQKFRSSMPSIFGPDEYHIVLISIFDSCIKCTFQQTLFTNRILELFPTPEEKNKNSYTEIKLENGTIIYIPSLETLDDFWNVICTFQNAILSGNDLFISTPPPSINNQSNGSLSPFLDSSTSPDLSPLYRSIILNKNKRKSTELTSSPENQTFLTNSKSARANSSERSVYDRTSSVNSSNPVNSFQNGTSRPPERYTPSDVAIFIRSIDPSFDNLASRFLHEEIDGKALLLLTTDTLMRHMGLKLGPSLKIVHNIEKLKKY